VPQRSASQGAVDAVPKEFVQGVEPELVAVPDAPVSEWPATEDAAGHYCRLRRAEDEWERTWAVELPPR